MAAQSSPTINLSGGSTTIFPGPQITYWVEGGLRVPFGSGYKGIQGNWEIKRTTAGLPQPVLVASGTFGSQIHTGGGVYNTNTGRISVQAPPAGGDTYQLIYQWKLIPVVGNPPINFTQLTATYTLMP